jgi:hypothetical protein
VLVDVEINVFRAASASPTFTYDPVVEMFDALDEWLFDDHSATVFVKSSNRVNGVAQKMQRVPPLRATFRSNSRRLLSIHRPQATAVPQPWLSTWNSAGLLHSTHS